MCRCGKSVWSYVDPPRSPGAVVFQPVYLLHCWLKTGDLGFDVQAKQDLSTSTESRPEAHQTVVGALPWTCSGWFISFSTHLLLVPDLRMPGANLPLCRLCLYSVVTRYKWGSFAFMSLLSRLMPTPLFNQIHFSLMYNGINVLLFYTFFFFFFPITVFPHCGITESF